MSRRLNKRQQREAEELEALKIEESRAKQQEAAEDSSDEGDIINPFSALSNSQPAQESSSSSSEGEQPTTTAPKKNKKKKPKKKKPSAGATPAPDSTSAPDTSAVTPKKKKKVKDELEGMDEVDRALAELKLKYGEETNANGETVAESSSDARSGLTFRNLLSVDPKNLDADAELRRFFGSKVIASTAQTNTKHRTTLSSKLKSTLARPKPTYPPTNSLSGLTMRELSEDEVDDLYSRRGMVRGDFEGDKGEKWFGFDHSQAWREVQRQFLGAVGSHDPNELMALLSVYPWHIDTLLQMSEVYRLQSDIGAASEYAERALYAFDRCLAPSFNITQGNVRLDFDRVENRPMFMALHRIISYLGRRGCWVTAFNFAKLLFALDPEGDPHAAALWLDFLAIKSGNSAWLLALLAQNEVSPAAADLQGYPGIGYARALALRAEEGGEGGKDHTKSDSALREAMMAFPQVLVLLADKIGASLPDGIRSNPLTQIEAGYSDTPTNVLHLLSHIYVTRSEALWKEAPLLKWFESILSTTYPLLNSPLAQKLRAQVTTTIHQIRDPLDGTATTNVPLHICRHVVCSESTSFIGFLPPTIRSRPVHAFDPLPPSTAISIYNQDYFSGVPSRSGGGGGGRVGAAAGGVIQWLEGRLRGVIGLGAAEWPERVGEVYREMVEGRGYADVPVREREAVLQHGQFLRVADQMMGEAHEQHEHQEGGMPGGFPGQD